MLFTTMTMVQTMVKMVTHTEAYNIATSKLQNIPEKCK